MVFELHVWGPAFGLPSIDPSCIATVAYLNRTVPRGQWSLVADHDTSLSPRRNFPLLIDADQRITGFTNIVTYLCDNYGEAYNLDAVLKHKQSIDRTAIISFLESTADPLVDLYLYVSSENYNTTTSAAYTAILPWYLNYTIPPKRRDLARARTAHLGLSSLDVAEASEETQSPGRGTASSEYEAAKRAAGIPGSDHTPSLNMGRGKGLLGSPIYAARFRLDALSGELLQPLADQLSKKEYMFGNDTPSSLDCLVFGYLALLRYAPVPQAWVQESLRTKFPKLDKYVTRLRAEFLKNEIIKAEDVWCVGAGKAAARDFQTKLPWVKGSHGAVLPQLLGALHDGVLPHAFQNGPVVIHGKNVNSKIQSSELPSPFALNTLATVTSAVAIGLTALAIHHRKTPRDGPLIFWALRPLQPVFDGFGVDSFLKHL